MSWVEKNRKINNRGRGGGGGGRLFGTREKRLETVNYFRKKITILDVSQVLSSPLPTINQMFLTNNRRAISRFLGMVALTT